MHSVHEINPRQRRKNQRGERRCIFWCPKRENIVFYFLGGEATFFLSLSVNPCSNTGSGFPSKSGLKNCRTRRYKDFRFCNPKVAKSMFYF